MIESGEAITLYCDDKDPDGQPKNTRQLDPVLRLPDNLFIIGTVNVDETTYMFSPKVLDRANVIEFRLTPEEMAAFLGAPESPDIDQLAGKGERFAREFVNAAVSRNADSLTADENNRYEAEMNLFFAVLREHGADFGYRVAHEAKRFLHFYKALSGSKVWNPPTTGGGHEGEGTSPQSHDANRDWLDHAFDAVAVQKFLPKLHGSKVKLGLLLKKIFTICVEPHGEAVRNAKAVADGVNDAKSAAQLTEPSPNISRDARYPLTAEKIFRMWRQLNENGFTSFPES
jgi:hypothetical protein